MEHLGPHILVSGMLFQAKKFVNLQITANGRTVAVKLWVFANLSFDMLLGVKTLSALAITLSNIHEFKAVHSIRKSKTGTRSIESVDQISDLFPNLLKSMKDRQTDYVVDFKVRDDIPLIQRKPYRFSSVKEEFALLKVQQMLNDGLVELTESEFASPALVVGKKDDPDGTTNKMRLCADLREINQWTVQDPFPLPRIDDLLLRACGAKWFSKIDLRESFH